MALLENDMPKMQQLTKDYFNVTEYGVFLCIISGRSWESINKGITKTKFTEKEVIIIYTYIFN
jgi:hypothetical protein